MAFKTLKGRRILLNTPHIEKSPIELSPEVQAEIDKVVMKQWTALEVYAVGEDIKGIEPGDKVYVGVTALQSCERIDIDGDVKMLIGDYDVIIVW